MHPVLYFAYGSNMLIERLQHRCGSAQPLGMAWVEGYGVAFSKIGQDGSGKATLSTAAGARAYGVLFQLGAEDLHALDRIEGRGKGYERLDGIQVAANHNGGAMIPACTYISQPPHIDGRLRPYDWYLDLVVHGARQNALPSAYVETIAATEPIVDLVTGRQARLEALHVLGLAGHAP